MRNKSGAFALSVLSSALFAAGGARVIHFNRLANGEIWLLVIYRKSVKGNIPAHTLKAIREVIGNG